MTGPRSRRSRPTRRRSTRSPRASGRDAPIATARVEASGAYVLTIDDKEYDGGPLDLDLYVEKAPRPRQDPEAKPRQFAVTTLQPRWRQTEER